METWTMVGASRARTAERPTQPSLDLRSRAPWFYPDPNPAERLDVAAGGQQVQITRGQLSAELLGRG